MEQTIEAEHASAPTGGEVDNSTPDVGKVIDDMEAWFDVRARAFRARMAPGALTRPRADREVVGWCVTGQGLGAELAAPPLVCADLGAAISAADVLAVELGLSTRGAEPTLSDFSDGRGQWRSVVLYGEEDISTLITLFPLFQREESERVASSRT
jgi:hypothetical protein